MEFALGGCLHRAGGRRKGRVGRVWKRSLNVPVRTGPDAGCRLGLETVPLIKS